MWCHAHSQEENTHCIDTKAVYSNQNKPPYSETHTSKKKKKTFIITVLQ